MDMEPMDSVSMGVNLWRFYVNYGIKNMIKGRPYKNTLHRLPLRWLCLKSIIENWKTHYTLFSTSKDKNVKKKFEFLRRKYSFEIASALFIIGEFKEEYIDALVNKYLKVLDTNWFFGSSWEKCYSKFEEIGANLVHLEINDVFNDVFDEFPVEAHWQDVIRFLPNLEVFSFQEGCTDAILELVVKYCPNIVKMDLKNSDISNDGIKTLCLKKDGKVSCSKLKILFIEATEIREDEMKFLLQNLPSLELTDYYDLPQLFYNAHKDDLSALDKIEPYKLISLDLLRSAQKPDFDDLLKICLSVCPNLKSLKCPLSDKNQLNLFSKLSCLERLHLKNDSNSAIDINNLLKSIGGKLSSLSVQNYIISVSVLAKSCTRLNQLTLNTVRFIDDDDDDDDDSKLIFPRLMFCTLNNATNDSTTDKAVKLLLSSSPRLNSID